MAITRFEDLPSENSPINSENLNGNFDELGVKVGTSVDNNYRTNIIKGKNLFPNNIKTQTINGVTITKNNDKSITLNGTANANITIYDYIDIKLSTGTYTHSCQNNIPQGMYLSLNNISSTMIGVSGNTNKVTFTLSEDTSYDRYILYIASGVTLNNLTIYPMIEKGSNATTYEPYITPTINVDGEDIYVKRQDGIIESGSNANGNYIKFADGTLICTIIKTINIAINIAWGSLYIGDTATKYTYPIAFVGNNPVVNYSITGYNSAFVISWTQSGNKLVETDRFALVRGKTASAQDYVLNITAIGRWK